LINIINLTSKFGKKVQSPQRNKYLKTIEKQKPFAETNGFCFLAPIEGKILFFFSLKKKRLE
jgi:hypothetical protein